MQGSFKLGTLAGIDIRIHYTWLLAISLIAWSLALGYFPMSNDSAGPVTYWALAIVAAVLLFASVLIHELAHSLVAGARGCTSTTSHCSSAASRTLPKNPRRLWTSSWLRW